MLSVIFDLDGTLVDSEPNPYESGRRALERHGAPESNREPREQHSPLVDIGTRETPDNREERYGPRAHPGAARAGTEAFPEMRRFVERLHADGVPTAVASGSSREAIETVLAGTGLEALLGVVVSAEEVAHGKPDPDVFLEAARRLGADPADCVVVEDAAPGAEAARAAGMECLAIPSAAGAAGHPAFASAGLMFRGGPGAFDVETAYEWLGEHRAA
ncbi:HAD family hydrolase [Streptomyces sp. NPDC058279]|uniref:HAD family hydrolase n=1 Tax=Streptomyces sp. NPDC058279 TaxID=3346418 RepID=UPI0036E44A14